MNNGEVYLSDAIGIIEEVLESGGEFLLSPKGTSMLPLIVQGKDSVVLKRYDVSVPKNHDIVFYRRADGVFVLHRIVRVSNDGSFVMCGDNQLVLEHGILPEQILAYVSAIHKKDRILSLSSFRYRIYVRIWCWFPYRRSVMFLKQKAEAVKRKLFSKKKSKKH